MRNKSLDALATRLQRRSAAMHKDRTLTVYILCCTIGAIACGYVAIIGIDRHYPFPPVAPIHAPVLLYDSTRDTAIVHSLIKSK